MKYTKLISLVFLVLLTALSACRKNFEELDEDQFFSDPTIVTVETTVVGKVTDENDRPLRNAEITAPSGDLVYTNDDGLFLLKNIKADRNGAFVKASFRSHHTAGRRFYPRNGSTNYVNIKLIKEDQTSRFFEAADGGNFTTPDGAKINIPSNAIVDQAGALYQGRVIVFINWLDPTVEDIQDLVPGDFTGQRVTNQLVGLRSYSMLAVNLKDQQGNLLQIADGQKAELTFPVPNTLQGDAPPTIPLWYFDETEGIWKEEGQAVLQNGKYLGEVSHFTFWNCDDPYDFIRLSGRFTYSDGSPLVNYPVRITLEGNGEANGGKTDKDGFFTGYVPAGESMVLELFDLCNDGVLYTETIGAFTEDKALDLIELVDEGDYSRRVKVSGSVFDCQNKEVNSGVVSVIFGDQRKSIFLEDDNSFEFDLQICNDITDIEVTAFSFNNEFISVNESFDLADDQSNLELGVLLICDDLGDDYMTVETDSFTAYFTDIFHGISTGVFNNAITADKFLSEVVFLNKSQSIIFLNGEVRLSFDATSPGIVSDWIMWVEFQSGTGVNYRPGCSSQNPTLCESEEFRLSEIGAVGDRTVGVISYDAFEFEANTGASFNTPLKIKFNVTRI